MIIRGERSIHGNPASGHPLRSCHLDTIRGIPTQLMLTKVGKWGRENIHYSKENDCGIGQYPSEQWQPQGAPSKHRVVPEQVQGVITNEQIVLILSLPKFWLETKPKMLTLSPLFKVQCHFWLISFILDQPLRNAFRRMGIPSAFVPDHLDSFLSYTVVNYLKKVKQQVGPTQEFLKE